MFTTILFILCVFLLTGSIIGKKAIDLSTWLKRSEAQPETVPPTIPPESPITQALRTWGSGLPELLDEISRPYFQFTSDVTTQIGLEPAEQAEPNDTEISPPEIQSHRNPVIFTQKKPTVGYYQGLPRLTAPCHAKLVKLFLSGDVTIYCEPGIIQACKNSDIDLFHELVCLPLVD